jgi:hypothetical protein
VDLCITGRAWSSPLDDAVITPVPLADVPAKVYSQAMRDRDPAVSATTAASNPAWLEKYRGQPAIGQYRERITRGAFSSAPTTSSSQAAPPCRFSDSVA